MDDSGAPWRALETVTPPAPAASPPARDPRPVAAAILAVGAALIATAIALAGAPASGDVGVEAGASGSSGLAELDPGTSAERPPGTGTIIVEVAGAVLRPGVYRLPPDARVADLVAVAGGYGPRIDADAAARALNLAAVVTDGSRVWVPSRDDPVASTPPADDTAGGPPTSGGTAADPAGGDPIDLNAATQGELETLPGIGPVTAARIIAAREEQPFVSVDDLRARKVVGPATFDKIDELVVVR